MAKPLPGDFLEAAWEDGASVWSCLAWRVQLAYFLNVSASKAGRKDRVRSRAERLLVLLSLLLLLLAVLSLHAEAALRKRSSIAAAMVLLAHFLDVCMGKARGEDAASQRWRISDLSGVRLLLACKPLIACVALLVLLTHFLSVRASEARREDRACSGSVALVVGRLRLRVVAGLMHDGVECLVWHIRLLLLQLAIHLLLAIALLLRSRVAVVLLTYFLSVRTRKSWREDRLSTARSATRSHAVCRSPDRLGMSAMVPVLNFLDVCSGEAWLEHSSGWAHRSEELLLLLRLHLVVIVVVCVGHGKDHLLQSIFTKEGFLMHERMKQKNSH